MSAIGQLFVELGINTAAFTSGLDKATYNAQKSAKEIGRSFSELKRTAGEAFLALGEQGSVLGGVFQEISGSLGAVSKAMGAASGGTESLLTGFLGVGIAAGAAAVGLGEMAKAGAQLIFSLDQMSKKTGISISDLQGLQAAGSTVGLSLDQMVQGFRRFDQGLAGVGKSSGAARMALDELHVTSTDNKDAILQVADAFSKMKDGPGKAAYAVALFGRAGLNMIPILDQGRQGLMKWDEAVAQYGTVIGEDAKNADEAYMEAQAKLNLSWQSLTITAEKEFLPAISKIITRMAELTKATSNFVNSNISWGEVGDYWKNLLTGQTPGKSFQIAAPNVEKNTEMEAGERADAKATAEAMKQYEIAQQGGKAEYALFVLKEKIAAAADLGTAKSLQMAAALEYQLPLAEHLAQLEKERLSYLASQKDEAITQYDYAANLVNKLAEQAAAQREIASQTAKTTGALLMQNAAVSAKKQLESTTTQIQNEEHSIRGQLTAKHITPAEQAKDPRILFFEQMLKTLQKDAPQIVALQEEIAAGGAVSGAAKSVMSSRDKFKEQAIAVQQLADAYKKGDEAIQSAQIAQKLTDEQKAIDEAQSALDAYIAVNGRGAASVDVFEKKLSDAKVAYKESADALRASDTADLTLSLAKASNALADETAAFNENAKAAFGDAEAKAKAAGAAAAAKLPTTATDEQRAMAAANATQAAEQKYNASVLELAVSHDLTTEYQNQVEKLQAAGDILKANGQSTLQVAAALYDEQNRVVKEWDEAANKVGNFKDRMGAALNELQLSGQNFWGDFSKAGMDAVNSLETALAKLTVEGNHGQSFQKSLHNIGTGLAESVLGNAEKSTLGLGAGLLKKAIPGLGGLLPGKKADGSKTNPFYVTMSGPLSLAAAAEPGAGGAGGAASGTGSLLGNIPGSGGLSSLLESFGGFLAGGGDVTPGNAYVVGEKHPEFFVPDKPGTVVPALKTGNTVQQNISLHLHGVTDADSFRRSQNQTLTHLTNAVSRANGRR